MSTFRLKRINELMKHELSELIRSRLPLEKHGLISVTDVEVTKDLKTACVYVSTVTVGVPRPVEEILAALEKIRVDLQHELSRKVIIKYTPRLVFKWDDGLERGQHMVDLLEKLGQAGDEGGRRGPGFG